MNDLERSTSIMRRLAAGEPPDVQCPECLEWVHALYHAGGGMSCGACLDANYGHDEPEQEYDDDE